MQTIVYTKPDCPYCSSAKLLLTIKQIPYTEVEIGKDILREDFVATFPEVRTAPYIILNGVKLGGYDELKRYFDQQTVAG